SDGGNPGGPPPRFVSRFANGAHRADFVVPSAYWTEVWTPRGDFAADRLGNMYFWSGSTVQEFPAGAVTGTPPTRTISLPPPSLGRMATAPDGTLYVAAFNPGVRESWIYAIAPGATLPSRIIQLP